MPPNWAAYLLPLVPITSNTISLFSVLLEGRHVRAIRTVYSRQNLHRRSLTVREGKETFADRSSRSIEVSLWLHSLSGFKGKEREDVCVELTMTLTFLTSFLVLLFLLFWNARGSCSLLWQHCLAWGTFSYFCQNDEKSQAHIHLLEREQRHLAIRLIHYSSFCLVDVTEDSYWRTRCLIKNTHIHCPRMNNWRYVLFCTAVFWTTSGDDFYLIRCTHGRKPERKTLSLKWRWPFWLLPENA